MAPHIAIIGGGFAGTLALVNLVRQAEKPISISLFEEGGRLAEGVAYGTKDPVHLLNVRAELMGAFPDAVGDFWQWLQSPQGAEAAKMWPEAHAKGFAPRMLYGRYIHSLLSDALTLAERKGIAIALHQKTGVSDAEQSGYQLSLNAQGQRNILPVDFLVLATGNLPPKRFCDSPSSRYVGDIWQPDEDGFFPGQVSGLSKEDEIVILGTGLTTVDAILTLEKNGYPGKITAISRNGLFPRPHADANPYIPWEWTGAPKEAPKTAYGLLRGFRQELRKAEAAGYGWRSVVDSIRAVTQILWEGLPLEEKSRFTRRVLGFWNIHRHRMAPNLWQKLQELQEQGRLRVLSASIIDVKPQGEGMVVTCRKRRATEQETLAAALVLNCTGPNHDVTRSGHVLLQSLIKHGMVTPHPLKAGLVLDRQGCCAASGDVSQAIYPMGALMIGEWLECTAVPELRQQAQQVAREILARV